MVVIKNRRLLGFRGDLMTLGMFLYMCDLLMSFPQKLRSIVCRFLIKSQVRDHDSAFVQMEFLARGQMKLSS